MKPTKFFFIFLLFSGLLFSCQDNNEIFNKTNVVKKQQLIKLKKPTSVDALNFIKLNLLTDNKNHYLTRGLNDDYQLEIDTTYFMSYKNKPFLKLVCFSPKGYALVSDIDNVPNPPVLFYDNNKFNKNKVNPALIEYIEEFFLTHSTVGRFPTDDEDKDGDGAWDDGRDTDTGDPRDSPYYHKEVVLKTWTEDFVKGPLITSHCSQGEPFNNNSRTNSQELAVAGCVAIAVGQIMNYYKKNTNKDYNWNKINRPYEFKKEIAEFINDIGKGVKMKYGIKQSRASDKNARNYFIKSGYPNTYQIDYNYDTLKKYIDNNKPVYLSAYENKERDYIIKNIIKNPFIWIYSGGHAWVADGYKTIYQKKKVKIDEGNKIGGGITYNTYTHVIGKYIHMNWGWGRYYQLGGGWCTYDYFKHRDLDSNYKYMKRMMIPLQ